MKNNRIKLEMKNLLFKREMINDYYLSAMEIKFKVQQNRIKNQDVL